MTSETNHQARHTTPALPAIPRRVLIAALLRAFLSVLVMVTIYFLIPLDHLSETRSIVELVLGVLLVVTCPGHSAPRGRAFAVSVDSDGGGPGHNRPALCHRVRHHPICDRQRAARELLAADDQT